MNQDERTELMMLGTGNAAAIHCYNTCFLLRNDSNILMVDGGGGNGVLLQLERLSVPLEGIHDIFVTHVHTDHLFGVVWMIRMIAQKMNQKTYSGTLRVYGHDKALSLLRNICMQTLPSKITARIGNGINLCVLQSGDSFTVGKMQVTCFDIHSAKEKQFGFRAQLPGGGTLACLGDEPFHETCREWVQGVDWLLCEAFCLYRDRDIFSPYEKHHSTAWDAGKTAQELHVKHLVLYHTEDKTLATRRATYMAEARRDFDGTVTVPDDLDVIPLD